MEAKVLFRTDLSVWNSQTYERCPPVIYQESLRFRCHSSSLPNQKEAWCFFRCVQEVASVFPRKPAVFRLRGPEMKAQPAKEPRVPDWTVSADSKRGFSTILNAEGVKSWGKGDVATLAPAAGATQTLRESETWSESPRRYCALCATAWSLWAGVTAEWRKAEANCCLNTDGSSAAFVFTVTHQPAGHLNFKWPNWTAGCVSTVRVLVHTSSSSFSLC